MTGEYMTAGQAQEYLGVSKRKLWRLMADGVLSFELDPLDKRLKLLKRSEVEELKARSKRAA